MTKLAWPALSQSCFSPVWPDTKMRCFLIPEYLHNFLVIGSLAFWKCSENWCWFIRSLKSSIIKFLPDTFHHLRMCYFWDMYFFKNAVKKSFPKYLPTVIFGLTFHFDYNRHFVCWNPLCYCSCCHVFLLMTWVQISESQILVYL